MVLTSLILDLDGKSTIWEGDLPQTLRIEQEDTNMTKRTFTNKAYREAIAQAYAEGRRFLGYIWDGVEFEGLTIKRVYEVK